MMTQAVSLVERKDITEIFTLLASNTGAQAKIIAYQADDLQQAGTHVLGLKIPKGNFSLISKLLVLGFEEKAPLGDGYQLMSAPLDVTVSELYILSTAEALGFVLQPNLWLVHTVRR